MECPDISKLKPMVATCPWFHQFLLKTDKQLWVPYFVFVLRLSRVTAALVTGRSHNSRKARKDSRLRQFFARVSSPLFKPFRTHRHPKVTIRGEKALGSAFDREEQRL
jgi:hypothetical protein